MPDETSTLPADTQAPPPQSGDTAAGQASEPEQFSSENLTGKPNTPTTPSKENTTPPQPLPLEDSVLPLRKGGEGGEETPAPESTPEPQAQPVQGSGGTQQATQTDTTPSQSPPSKGGEVRSFLIIGELPVKARAKIQERRRKKLEKIMAKVTETGKISTAQTVVDTLDEWRMRRNALTAHDFRANGSCGVFEPLVVFRCQKTADVL